MKINFLAAALPMLFSAQLLTSAPAQALDVGESAPCVHLKQVLPDNSTTEGCLVEHSPTQRFTLVDFFSITCGACIANLPALKALTTEIAATTQVRSVSVDRNEASVNSFISQRRTDLNYPVALDSNRDALRAYDIRYTPTTFIFDAEEKVIYKHVGSYSEADLEEIRNLVK